MRARVGTVGRQPGDESRDGDYAVVHPPALEAPGGGAHQVVEQGLVAGHPAGGATAVPTELFRDSCPHHRHRRNRRGPRLRGAWTILGNGGGSGGVRPKPCKWSARAQTKHRS